jgi:hypothetical protein
MKHLHLIVAVMLYLTAVISAQKTPSADSSASSASSASGKASSIDGDLILDDNDNAILPVEVKKKVAPAAKATLKADTTAVNTAAPVIVPAAQQSPLLQTPAQKVTDEELILEGGAEELLGKGKTLKPKIAVPSGETSPLPADSAATEKQTTARPLLQTPGAFADSAAGATNQSATISTPAAKIEDARAINFARNLKEYRSPKLAMLMSLVLPGSGQVYAKSNLWAAAFGAIEAAIITTGFTLSAKAAKVKKNAHGFADQHYDTAAMRGYLDSLYQYLQKLPPTAGVNPDDKADSIFNKVIFVTKEDSTFFIDARQKNDAYYGYLDRGTASPFIRGWEDVQPAFTSNGFILNSSDSLRFGKFGESDTSYRVFLLSDSSNTMYGYSDYQKHYNQMLRDSRDWADRSRTTFLTLLLNHIASSVMAGIAAKKHNDELLGKESFWRRIDLEQRYVFTGSETAPGYTFQVAF